MYQCKKEIRKEVKKEVSNEILFFFLALVTISQYPFHSPHKVMFLPPTSYILYNQATTINTDVLYTTIPTTITTNYILRNY